MASLAVQLWSHAKIGSYLQSQTEYNLANVTEAILALPKSFLHRYILEPLRNMPSDQMPIGSHFLVVDSMDEALLPGRPTLVEFIVMDYYFRSTIRLEAEKFPASMR